MKFSVALASSAQNPAEPRDLTTKAFDLNDHVLQHSASIDWRMFMRFLATKKTGIIRKFWGVQIQDSQGISSNSWQAFHPKTKSDQNIPSKGNHSDDRKIGPFKSRFQSLRFWIIERNKFLLPFFRAIGSSGLSLCASRSWIPILFVSSPLWPSNHLARRAPMARRGVCCCFFWLP